MKTDRFTTSIAMEKVQMRDGFWKNYMETIRTKLIPYQWEALNDRVEGAAPSYCIRNFRIAAGLEQGEFGGKVFQDSDVAKWLEAVAYSLIVHPDPELEKTADGAIDLIVSAQQPDGYLNTYYIITGLDQRWTNLRDNHELYCAGHMLEAAVAYYRATGKRKLLDAMIRYVDHIDSVFGPEEGKLHGYPGHEVIEMALMRLYEITQDEKHMKLAKFFVDERGQEPHYFKGETHGVVKKWESFYMKYQYSQSHMPVRQQTEAVGHSVRAAYLYSGVADVARASQDEDLYQAIVRIWENLTRRRMYVTGSIGSSHSGEAFTFDYDLPNDTIYGETCAAVGLVFFAKRMLALEPRGEYADVMERALYNGVISGMTLDGTRFFYVNPLEVLPEASLKDEGRRHVRVERQKWFGTACCPPNLARLAGSVSDYMYGSGADGTFYVHLYGASDVEIDGLKLQVETQYPWEGKVKVTLKTSRPIHKKIALRIPGWCNEYDIQYNGGTAHGLLKDGYYYIEKMWRNDDVLELDLDMPVEIVRANPRVRANVGKAVLMRGPLVYCLEEADNGKDLHRIRLIEGEQYTAEYDPDLLGGIVKITGTGCVLEEWDDNALYASKRPCRLREQRLQWIPYYAWANRSSGELMVWIKE